MAVMLVMPELGESVVEGQVGRWLAQVGQRVDRDQPLVEILTDKADSELPAPAAGVVTKILAPEGTVVKVGAELCEIDSSASPSAQAPTSDAAVTSPGATAGNRQSV